MNRLARGAFSRPAMRVFHHPLALGATVALFASLGSIEPTSMHEDVQALLDHRRRDAAYERLLERGEWRGPGAYEEGGAESVRHVVMCPQEEGPPLFAVFLGEGELHRAVGHFVFVAADGALVRVHDGANELYGVLEDVTADGVLDVVDSHLVSEGEHSYEVLSVVPCTEEQQASLRIALRRPTSRRGTPGAPWGWQLTPTETGVVIELGPLDDYGWVAEAQALYSWDEEAQLWSGPAGGPEDPYERLPSP